MGVKERGAVVSLEWEELVVVEHFVALGIVQTVALDELGHSRPGAARTVEALRSARAKLAAARGDTASTTGEREAVDAWKAAAIGRPGDGDREGE